MGWPRADYELLQTRVLIPERALIGYASPARFLTQPFFTEEKQALDEAKKYITPGNIQIDAEKQSRYVGALALPAPEITLFIKRGQLYAAMEKRLDDIRSEFIHSTKTLVERIDQSALNVSGFTIS